MCLKLLIDEYVITSELDQSGYTYFVNSQSISIPCWDDLGRCFVKDLVIDGHETNSSIWVGSRNT